MKTKVEEALEVVTKALKKDKKYRESWRASIAMAYYDAENDFKRKNGKRILSNQDKHVVSNNAAELFLSWLCDEIKIPEGR
jgi:Tfp pilus assembly protein PilF